ncbi:hypothetical protein [Oculatella sp. LEGE 06141]|nr:hypothetical protein [Oculatella sp. LEGE 06141]
MKNITVAFLAGCLVGIVIVRPQVISATGTQLEDWWLGAIALLD